MSLDPSHSTCIHSYLGQVSYTGLKTLTHISMFINIITILSLVFLIFYKWQIIWCLSFPSHLLTQHNNLQSHPYVNKFWLNFLNRCTVLHFVDIPVSLTINQHLYCFHILDIVNSYCAVTNRSTVYIFFFYFVQRTFLYFSLPGVYS